MEKSGSREDPGIRNKKNNDYEMGETSRDQILQQGLDRQNIEHPTDFMDCD